MIEKYGVSYDDVPATDDQIREIKELSKKLGLSFIMPKTAKSAVEVIEELINR